VYSAKEAVSANNISEQFISQMTIRYLTSRKLVFPTKSILDEERRINSWLGIGACGSITYGRARIGKTVCMNYVAESIRNQYGSREMVIIWNVTDHPETERNFYASILMAMGYECPRYSTALILKERVLNELILRAHETPFKKAVMFIDEAWKLREKDFYWLMDLYNNLSGKDIQLSVFMYGTRELKDLKHSFKLQGKDQIVGRFMINESQFFGIQDPKELQFCMASVDKLHVCMTDYEILSDGLVDFYFPYADGKTFFDISNDFWEAFQRVRIQKRIASEDIPMKYFIDSLVICLNMHGKLGSSPIAFPTRKELESCVALSGYGESDDEYTK